MPKQKYSPRTHPIPELPHLIKTKTGRLLNTDLLDNVDVKRIRDERRIQPLEMDEKQWEEQLAKGKFAFKTKEGPILFNARNKNGFFQGAFQTRDGLVVVFRSKFLAQQYWVVDINEVLEDGIEALGHSVGQVISKPLNGETLDIEHREVVRSNRYVKKAFRRHGIASMAFDILEEHASANGVGGIQVLVTSQSEQNINPFLIDRGYTLTDSTIGSYTKSIPEGSSIDDMFRFHKFPVMKDGRKSMMVVPIKS
ncbi:MAG: hypothetical protein ABH950_05110 [Candidatus Altiarchaeota archaeon]